MKVSKDKYNAIKKATGTADKIASKFGVSCTTVRRIRGSKDYETYKGGMSKKGSLTTAMASGKKKAGSSSSTTKPSDKPESNPNKDDHKNDDGEIEEVKEKLQKRESSLVERHDALIHDYVLKANELDAMSLHAKVMTIVAIILAIGLAVATIL